MTTKSFTKGTVARIASVALACTLGVAALAGCSSSNGSGSGSAADSGTNASAAASTSSSAGASTSAAASSSTSAAASSSASAATPTKTYDVNIGHLNSTAHLLAFVAKEEGFFEAEGVNATLTQFSSAAELVSGLESEKLAVALIGSVPTLVNISSGHDLSVFGGAMTNGHGYVIKGEYTEGLDSWDPTILKGKNVAVPRTTVQELELYQILAKYNLTYSEGDDADVKITYFESQKDAYNAFANAEIDAVSTYSPYTSIAVADGASVVYNCYEEDIFENQPCCRQVALSSALDADPDQFEAIERALIKAYAFYKDPANKDKTIADVKKYIDIPEDEIDYEIFTPDYCDSNPDPDFQATENLKEGAVEFGYLTDFDLSEHYNLDIYDAALAALEKSDPSNTYYKELRTHFSTFQ